MSTNPLPPQTFPNKVRAHLEFRVQQAPGGFAILGYKAAYDRFDVLAVARTRPELESLLQERLAEWIRTAFVMAPKKASILADDACETVMDVRA